MILESSFQVSENSDVTSFNTNKFDVADALLDVYPETFTTGLDVSLFGGGGGGGKIFSNFKLSLGRTEVISFV